MRHTLIKFRSLVHIYVNRRRYLKVRQGLAHPRGPRHLLPPCCMLAGGSGEGTVAPPDPELPQTSSPPPPPCSMGHGQCLFGVKAWRCWGVNGTPEGSCCLRVSLPPGGASARLLCLQRKEDARRRAEEERKRMKQVTGCRHAALGAARMCDARATHVAVPSSLPRARPSLCCQPRHPWVLGQGAAW